MWVETRLGVSESLSIFDLRCHFLKLTSTVFAGNKVLTNLLGTKFTM